MRFAPLITSTFNTSSAVYYRKSGHYLNGRWVDDPAVGERIEVSVQSITGEALNLLPEGYTRADGKTFFTKERVDVGGSIEYNGERFKLIDVKDWSDIGDYWESVGLRETA